MGSKTSKRREAKKVASVVGSIEAERELARAHLDKIKRLPPRERVAQQKETDAAQMTLATRHDSVLSVVEVGPGVFKKARVIS